MNTLPAGWQIADLRDVTADVSYGFTTSSVVKGDGPKLLRITDIQNGCVDWSTVPHCLETPGASFLLQAGDIVIARTGATTGKSFLIGELACPTVFASYLIRARFADGVEPKYAWAFMQSENYWSQIQNVSKGTAQPGAIVAKIDSLSAKSKRARDQLDHIPRLVEKYKQAILAAAFDQALRSAGAGTSLANIAVEVRNGLSKKPHDSPPGMPILRISAVRSLVVNTEDQRYYPPTEAVPSEFLVREGDLLFTRYNGNPEFTAVCGVVRDVPDKLIYPDKLIRVRLNEKASPNFVELIFASPQARAWLWPRIKTAAGQHGISGKDLKECPVPLPPMAEQAKIVQHTRSNLTWVNRLALEATSARKLIDHLDQAVLAKAFRGELVPQDPNDEPASVLLERIRAKRSAAPAKVKTRGLKRSGKRTAG
jgi:type I restriction enzyme, S subunit